MYEQGMINPLEKSPTIIKNSSEKGPQRNGKKRTRNISLLALDFIEEQSLAECSLVVESALCSSRLPEMLDLEQRNNKMETFLFYLSG